MGMGVGMGWLAHDVTRAIARSVSPGITCKMDRRALLPGGGGCVAMWGHGREPGGDRDEAIREVAVGVGRTPTPGVGDGVSHTDGHTATS